MSSEQQWSVGEEVVYTRRGSNAEIRRITGISPSGRISLAGTQTTFNPDGSGRVGRDDRWRPWIAKLTPAKRAAIEAEERRIRVMTTNWSRVNDTTIAAIVALLDDTTPAPGPMPQ